MVVLNLHQDLVNRYYQGCEIYYFVGLIVPSLVLVMAGRMVFLFPLLPLRVVPSACLACPRFPYLYHGKSVFRIHILLSLY